MADINIGGRLHSSATGNIVTGANEVYDDKKQKRQSEINSDVDSELHATGTGVQDRLSTLEDEVSFSGEIQVENNPDNVVAGSGKVLTANAVVGYVRDNGGIFDISEYNNGAVYQTLAAALAGVPQDRQKGGMLVKYIDSTMQSYVVYRLMSTTWSDSAADWVTADESVVTDNPEFLKVWIDSDGHVLIGLQRDGNVWFGAGVPAQVKNYVLSKISEIDFSGLIAEIESALEGKVDKEEGKSLIDESYAGGVAYHENPEFMEAVTDSESKLLAGIKKDGKVWMNALHTKDIDAENSVNAKGGFSTKNFFVKVVKNPEFSMVYIDADDKVLFGIHADGSKYLGEELPSVYNQKTIRNLGLKPLTIAFVGDSIIEGYGSSDYNGGASGTSGHLIPNNVKTWYRNTGENCWVNKIINHLTTNYSNVVAVNNGIGGLRVSQVCANLPTIAVDDFGNKADVVIFSAGINDRNESDKDNSITSCIKSTKDWCDRNNIQLIVLTNTPLMNTVKPNNDYTVSSAIKKACKMYNIPCVDLFSNVIYYIEDKNISLASIMNDNLHPNDAGYEIIYRLVKKLLKI